MTPESAPEPERPITVVRNLYPDGTVKEEIHYRGGSEHGPWRRWYANGQLAGEWWLDVGAYVNGTNRTWYPDGTLESEEVYVNGRCIRERRFSPKGKPLPTLADVQRASVRKMLTKARTAGPAVRRRRPPRQEIAREQEHIKAMLATVHAEAMTWLSASSEDSTRTLGEFDTDLSRELVHELYSMGAAEVLAVEIVSSPCDEHESTNHVLIRLPAAPEARARLLAFERTYARSQGFTTLGDYGQDSVYLMLC